MATSDEEFEQRMFRLRAVLDEFHLFKPDATVGITARAIGWACCALSDDDEVVQLEGMFYDWVTWLYTSTYAAEQKLNKTDLRTRQESSLLRLQQSDLAWDTALHRSAVFYAALPEDSLLRSTGKLMGMFLNGDLIRHSAITYRPIIIMQCSVVCGDRRLERMGLSIASGMGLSHRVELCSSLQAMWRDVESRIDSGSLAFKDGRLESL
jgi:hypothetical protein